MRRTAATEEGGGRATVTVRDREIGDMDREREEGGKEGGKKKGETGR